MRIDYVKLLSWVRWAAVALFGFVVTTIVGGFILKLCDDEDWYRHAWKTVAKMFAIVTYILSATWFHWLGGAALGFALGIWLDDLLRRLAATSPPAAKVSPPEKGFLDYQKQYSEACTDMARVLNNAIMKMEWITKQMNERTAITVKTLGELRGQPSAVITASGHQMAKIAAGKLDIFTRDMAECAIEMGTVAASFSESVLWLFQHRQDIQDDAATLAVIDQLRANSEAARINIMGFVSALPYGISAVLNNACSRTKEVMDKFVVAITAIENQCRDMLALVAVNSKAP